MIKQGIYQMYSAAYWNLQIICSSKFSEDDDAIDIERQATNMFIWRMRHCAGKLLFGGGYTQGWTQGNDSLPYALYQKSRTILSI